MAAHRVRGVIGAALAAVVVLMSALTPDAALAEEVHEGPAGGRLAPGAIFSPPVDLAILRGYDEPPLPWAAGHRGVDLSAGEEAPVLAAGAGTVAFAGVVVDRPVVSIDHPVGIRTTYEPVTPAVTAGQRVDRGQVIGSLAPGNGHCPDLCLHWGARIGQKEYLDPLRLLRPPRMRLYPPEPW